MSPAMNIDVTATTGTRMTDEDARTWAEAWQASWDAQQTGFMLDREQRFAALLDLVEVMAGPAPTVVDLACGTASITRRTWWSHDHSASAAARAALPSRARSSGASRSPRNAAPRAPGS